MQPYEASKTVTTYDVKLRVENLRGNTPLRYDNPLPLPCRISPVITRHRIALQRLQRAGGFSRGSRASNMANAANIIAQLVARAMLSVVLA